MADNPNAPAGDDVIDTIKASMGPEFEYLTDALAPAITSAAQKIVDRTLQSRDDQVHIDGVMKEFGEANPDWAEHEEAMLDLAQKIHPKGMSEREYLDHLHDTVVREKARAAAAETERASRERPARDADDDASTPPTRPTIAEAFAAAKRGIRWK